MARYLISRFFQALLVMFGVSLLIFFSLHLTGDPAAVMMPPGATSQEIADFRHAMGFDRPLLAQYADYAGHLLRGDLGDSLRYGQPVSTLIAERLPATALLALTALAWSTLAGLALGLISALWRDRHLGSAGAPGGVQRPGGAGVWLGAFDDFLFFSLQLRWLPSGGLRRSATAHHAPLSVFGRVLHERMARLVRASLIDVLDQEYIRTARAKGLSAWSGAGAPRAAQRADPGGDGSGDLARRPARRRAGHRDYLRLARYRPSGGAGHPEPRFPAGAGRGAARRADVRGR